MALVQLASVLFNEGRFADAREALEEALPIVVASGFRYREAVVVSNLASIVVQQGELGYGRRLIARGLDLCIDAIQSEFFRNRLGGAPVVSGRHHDLHAERVQFANRLRCGRLDRIGHRQQSGDMSIDELEKIIKPMLGA